MTLRRRENIIQSICMPSTEIPPQQRCDLGGPFSECWKVPILAKKSLTDLCQSPPTDSSRPWKWRVGLLGQKTARRVDQQFPSQPNTSVHPSQNVSSSQAIVVDQLTDQLWHNGTVGGHREQTSLQKLHSNWNFSLDYFQEKKNCHAVPGNQHCFKTLRYVNDNEIYSRSSARCLVPWDTLFPVLNEFCNPLPFAFSPARPQFPFRSVPYCVYLWVFVFVVSYNFINYYSTCFLAHWFIFSCVSFFTISLYIWGWDVSFCSVGFSPRGFCQF